MNDELQAAVTRMLNAGYHIEWFLGVSLENEPEYVVFVDGKRAHFPVNWIHRGQWFRESWQALVDAEAAGMFYTQLQEATT